MTVLEILKGAKKHLATSKASQGKKYHICFAINTFVLSCEAEGLYENRHEAKRLVEAGMSKLAPRLSTLYFSRSHAKIVLGLGSGYGKVTIDQIQEARHKFLDQLIAELEQK